MTLSLSGPAGHGSDLLPGCVFLLFLSWLCGVGPLPLRLGRSVGCKGLVEDSYGQDLSLSSRDWLRIAVSRGGQRQVAGRRFFPKRKTPKEHSQNLFDLARGRRVLPCRPLNSPKRVRGCDAMPPSHFFSCVRRILVRLQP